MAKLTKQNLDHIKDIFERETGVELEDDKKGQPVGKLALICAIVLVGMVFAAFTVPLFSPLDGDELTLYGTYLGDGIVSVWVENRSD